MGDCKGPDSQIEKHATMSKYEVMSPPPLAGTLPNGLQTCSPCSGQVVEQSQQGCWQGLRRHVGART